jgi:hypothetical protein
MIMQYGQVVVSESEIIVRGFHFDGTDGETAFLLAVKWAMSRLAPYTAAAAGTAASDVEGDKRGAPER